MGITDIVKNYKNSPQEFGGRVGSVGNTIVRKHEVISSNIIVVVVVVVVVAEEAAAADDAADEAVDDDTE